MPPVRKLKNPQCTPDGKTILNPHISIDFAEDLIEKWVCSSEIEVKGLKDSNFRLILESAGDCKVSMRVEPRYRNEFICGSWKMYQPLCDFEIHSDVGRTILKNCMKYRDAVLRVTKGSTSLLLHPGDNHWKHRVNDEFLIDMQVLHRISTKGFYPDPNAPEYTELLKMSEKFNDDLRTKFNLSDISFNTQLTNHSWSYLDGGIRYGPLVISKSEVWEMDLDTYNSMGLDHRNLWPDHKDFKPLTLDLHAGTLHRAKLAVELEVAMTTGPIESLNFRNIFPRHPDLRFDFDPIEYLSKPSLDLSPVADFRDRILMRMFINSLRWLALGEQDGFIDAQVISKEFDLDILKYIKPSLLSRLEAQCSRRYTNFVDIPDRVINIYMALDIHRPLLHSHSKFCDFDFTQFLTDLDEYVF